MVDIRPGTPKEFLLHADIGVQHVGADALSRSLSPSLASPLSLFLTYTHKHTHARTHTQTHTHTHTLSLSLSHSLSHLGSGALKDFLLHADVGVQHVGADALSPPPSLTNLPTSIHTYIHT